MPSDRQTEHEGGEAVPGDEYYVLASSRASQRRKHVLSHGDAFAVLDQSGDVPLAAEEELGFFYRGTRHLSQLELLVGGVPPFFLSGRVTADNLRAIANLTNNDVWLDGTVVSRATLSIQRAALLAGPRLLVQLVLHAFSLVPLPLRLDLRFGADFADVFQVRGIARAATGRHDAPRVERGALVFAYQGLDGVRRTTRIEITGGTPAWTGTHARLELHLAPEEEREIEIAITCENADVPSVAWQGFGGAEALREREHVAWQRERAAVVTGDEGLNAIVEQALADVFMLTVAPEPGTPHAVDRYVYAGIPWFATIFGRDGLVTARELLTVAPTLARSVLRVLAALQGREEHAERDEEPGKILHEARYGEMAATGEVPFGRYYGSVDATPLFLVLLGDYARATGDLGLVRELWPNALAALEWMARYGDRDGDGYLEYARRGEHGLVNQGWKDSGDAVFHSDGGLAEPPIALVEVQGYRYAALCAMARLGDAIGAGEPARWRAQATALRDAINRDFWLDPDDTYAIALDRDKRPCAVVSSNPGHLLFCGVPDADRGGRLAARLLRSDIWSGWGVRTIARGQPRYNPMSYHNGSVWPHDNALIAAGLRRYGAVTGTVDVLSALVGAATHFDDRRLPELFCGFARRHDRAPVPYPVACRPQAWAAGSLFLLLEAALGLEIDAAARRLVLREPRLPAWLPWIELRKLRIGDATVDINVLRGRYGGSVEILRKDGDVEIVETR
jgi:glycogen debranching enzyme